MVTISPSNFIIFPRGSDYFTTESKDKPCEAKLVPKLTNVSLDTKKPKKSKNKQKKKKGFMKGYEITDRKKLPKFKASIKIAKLESM